MNNTTLQKKKKSKNANATGQAHQAIGQTFATAQPQSHTKDAEAFLAAVGESVAQINKTLATETALHARQLTRRGPKKGSSSFTDLTVDQLIKLVGQNRHVGIPVRRVWIDRFQSFLKPAASETTIEADSVDPIHPIQFSVDTQ
jgi:hypothetical protein